MRVQARLQYKPVFLLMHVGGAEKHSCPLQGKLGRGGEGPAPLGGKSAQIGVGGPSV